MPPDVRLASGWGVLHLFLKGGGVADAEEILDAVAKAEKAGTQVVAVAMLGHKADLGIMALAPEMWALRELQTDLQAAGLEVADSYVSLTEVSEYAAGMPDEMKKTRLYPSLPPEGKAAFCFYPMSKRRVDGANWYETPYEEREALMQGHGKTGRTFAGRVLQLITGSTGLDDWEWGVSLFANGPDDLKDVVYTMRFDEASARFAEFGPFYTGMVAPLEEVLVATGLR